MNGRNIFIIGLTGGISSGKSTVADIFQEHGIKVVDADMVGRELLEPHRSCWQVLKYEFGETFFDEDKRVDRAALRKAIFSDEETRNQVNKLFHPLIRTGIQRILEQYANTLESGDRNKIVIVEVPLLFESGWIADFDWIIVVYADREKCLERLMARDRVSRAEAEAAIMAQMPLAQKIELADSVIDNSGGLEWTRRQVEKELKEIVASRSNLS
ncbi:MAG: dephospho-CoA kinase [Proteobacteria bacterium]|nr:dephospho-CoA kinase [Pseudomonadota bacterium]MBU1739244.1 dephospho-CoA kinase [Pseudomonadota bacterium]